MEQYGVVVNRESLAQLDAALQQGKVPDKDKEFVTGLVKNAHAGRLKEKGWHWVGVMAKRILQGATVRVVGDFSGVYTLFQKAAAHLKYPKIRLQTEAGVPLQLYLSGKNSRVPHVVNVTDGGRYGEARWYGRVTPGGEWQPNDRIPERDQLPVEGLLKQLAKDPAGVAAAYGKLTGNCCFCSRKLADERSTEVGYGPVCARRYGQPWGK